MGELEGGGWSRGEVASVLVAPAVACPQAGRPVSGLGRGQASEGWDSESCTQRQTGEGTMIENGPVG